jgi:hypothetical protein
MQSNTGLEMHGWNTDSAAVAQRPRIYSPGHTTYMVRHDPHIHPLTFSQGDNLAEVPHPAHVQRPRPVH